MTFVKKFHCVLLVEDHTDMALMIKKSLESKGYVVFWAENGEEALKKLEILNNTYKPCLILCDLAMPIMDGWEFVERVGKSNKLLTIPVVIHSGESKTPPGYPVIKKPADLKAITVLVEKYCGKPDQLLAEEASIIADSNKHPERGPQPNG